MGLDVRAYCGLVPFVGEADELDPFVVYVGENVDFPGRETGVKTGVRYRADGRLHFRLSYGRYNVWRNELAMVSGWPPSGNDDPASTFAASAWASDGGPFWELINFTDCDGVIGPVVAAKLSREFDEWRERALEEGSGRLLEFYDLFADAMRKAADGGVVIFS